MTNKNISNPRSGFSFQEVLIFVCPLLMAFQFSFVGQLFLSELILAGLLPALLIRGVSNCTRYPMLYVIWLGFLWLLAQVVTDVLRNSYYYDFLRGWAGIIFFIIEILSIYLIIEGSKRRQLIFGVGLAFGSIIPYLINYQLIIDGYSFWKFGVGYAVSLLIVLLTQSRLISQSKSFVFFLLLMACALNFIVDVRSLAGICLITAIYSLFQGKYKSNKYFDINLSISKRFLSLVVLFLIGLMLLKLYGAVAEFGIFGGDSRDKYLAQSTGEFGLLIGGRQEVLVSTQAILDSPIIGHGSWAKDPKYAGILQELLYLYGYEDLRAVDYLNELDEDLILTHSFIFGAWVYAGFFGAVFWFWILGFCQTILLSTYKVKEKISPLIIFLALNLLWNTLFSPFGGQARINAAYQIAMMIIFFNIIKFGNYKTALVKRGLNLRQEK